MAKNRIETIRALALLELNGHFMQFIFSKNRFGIKTGLIYLLMIFSFLKPAFAQIYPVQANIHVSPPYSVYLSHYTSPEQEKIMVSILLHDPVITSIDVKFRFTIQGGGIKLTTNPGWIPTPYTLSNGVNTILPSDFISDYLNQQHLLVEGVNPTNFFRNGKLPEGFYEFKVEVMEYRRGVVISNLARTGLWLLLNEAPRIVFPMPNQKVIATNPQMLNFTWVPGGISSPLSAQNTMYEFTLVELPDNIDPQVAINSAREDIKFVKTTSQTNLFYGPGEMTLLLGRKYAVRVKAYNTEGLELFKNNGFSDVRVFTFGDACNPPISFTLEKPGQSAFEVNVQTDPGNTAWQAQFRESGQATGKWSQLKSEPGTNIKTVKGLKASTTYELQVKGICGLFNSDFTTSRTITTTAKVNTTRSCDGNPTPFAADNAPALQQLKKDDIFLAALFPIKVSEVKSQTAGKFTGTGIATVPLFNTGLIVTFNDVAINNLMQLTSGEVKAVRNKFNLNLFGDTPPTGDTGGGTDDTGGTGTTGDGNYPPITDSLVLDYNVDSIIVVDETTIIIIPSGGGGESGGPITVTIPGGSCTKIIPANGSTENTKVVYNGAVHPYKGDGGTTTGAENQEQFKGYLARFKPAINQKYGFDSLRHQAHTNYYQEMEIDGKLVKLPWKALALGLPEPVKLNIKRSTESYPYSNLKVSALGGLEMLPTEGANTANQTYSLPGTVDGDETPIVATFTEEGKTKYAGGIWAVTYSQKSYKLIIVPLPNINIDEAKVGRLQNELNLIYSQAVVSWSVSQLKGFSGVTLGENGLDWADKDMLSSYNEEMNNLISAFKGWKPLADEDAYYLFVVPKFSESGLEGFMPRNRRFGFVTADQLDGRLIAHEIGHGAFNLRHTFPEALKGSTDNLMDYTQDKYALLKPQWDLIHNPEATTGLWDGMEDGASKTKMTSVLGLFSASFDKNSYNFFGSLDNPQTEIPIISFKYNLKDTSGYKIMFSDGKETKQIFQKQIYSISDKLKFLYEVPGAKSVLVSLIDNNNQLVDSAIITTNIIDKNAKDDVNGDNVFGPISVKFDSKENKIKGGDTLTYQVTSCSFTLQVNELDFLTKKFNVTGANLTYKKLKSSGKIIEAGIVWDNKDGINIDSIAFFSAKITHIELFIDEFGKLKGKITLNAFLDNDYIFNDIVLIKKGLKGEFSFNYNKDNKGFLGTFNFEGLSNINMALTKDIEAKKPFAELKDGSIDKEGTLSGRFIGLEGTRYTSKGFTLTVNKLELDGRYNLKSKAFTPEMGEGRFTISKIKGAKGGLVFEVNYGDAITATLDKTNTDISIGGLAVKDLDITAVFSENFDFENAKGNLKLSHTNFGADLNVSNFEITNGEIKTLKISGNLNYGGFLFELGNCSYSASSGINMNGKIKLGSENKFEVKNMTIDTTGVFTCDKISGNVNTTYLSASVNVGLSKTSFNGNFSANMFGLNLKGSVDYGTANKKNSDPGYNTEPKYSYGHFAIVTSAIIPVFPGLKISKLGGEFGFNCAYDFTKKPWKLAPSYQTYIAGISLGIGDMAGIFDLSVDPALVQFNKNEVSISINSALSIPAKKPMFAGTAKLLLLYPSGNISGNIAANINIPDNKGWLMKTVGQNQLNFTKDKSQTKIYTTGLHAKILGTLDLTGNIEYTKNYDQSGNVTSTSGAISGDVLYSFDESIHLSCLWDEVKIDGSLKVDFNAGLNMSFDDSGSSGSIYGSLVIVPKANISVFGGNFGAEGYFSGAASVSYTNVSATLSAGYKIDLKCYAGSQSVSYSTSGDISKTFTY